TTIRLHSVNGREPEGVARFRLLASAIAGRAVDVEPGAPGDRAWTDGVTVFVPADATESDQVRSIAVQAALLSTGSLEGDVGAALARRAAPTRRYLAIEGHRALAAHEELLPPRLRPLIDTATASGVSSPAASLELARSNAAIADPPEWFGEL